MKLNIDFANKYVYPDAMVICGEIERAAQRNDAIANPKVIVEVLSKSTEAYDRGDKFFFYQQIPSFQTYILIDQYQPLVDVHHRRGDLWKISRVKGIENKLILESLNIEIPLASIYKNVQFEEKSALQLKHFVGFV